MRREIVLDTETTGISPKAGHRMVEIACVELDDRLPTGRTFHRYINPERAMDPEAERVHGLSDAFLADKPKFADSAVVEEFLAFVDGAPIIAHNAAFDRGFVNHELTLCGRSVTTDDSWICTYVLAQKRFPGMYNSLDALCKRYKVSLSEREKHGALIDARLLAAVYFQLQAAEAQAFDLSAGGGAVTTAGRPVYGARQRPLQPLSTAAERAAHAAFIHGVLKDKALWLKLEPELV